MSDTYDGPERRERLHLSAEQIEVIAEKAAAKAVVKMQAEFYQQVGRSVVSRFTVLLGLAVVCLVFWFNPAAIKAVFVK